MRLFLFLSMEASQPDGSAKTISLENASIGDFCITFIATPSRVSHWNLAYPVEIWIQNIDLHYNLDRENFKILFPIMACHTLCGKTWYWEFKLFLLKQFLSSTIHRQIYTDGDYHNVVKTNDIFYYWLYTFIWMKHTVHNKCFTFILVVNTLKIMSSYESAIGREEAVSWAESRGAWTKGTWCENQFSMGFPFFDLNKDAKYQNRCIPTWICTISWVAPWWTCNMS